jgi:predicted nucleic acid-binding Zn ribbon protein
MDQLFRLLPKVIEQAREPETLREAAVLSAWRRVAGESLTANAAAIALYGATLVVAVPDTLWKRQMELMAKQLLFSINAAFGTSLVRFIEFKVDLDAVLQQRASHGAGARLIDHEIALKQTVGALQNAADATIADHALRAKFLLAAACCLERTARKE